MIDFGGATYAKDSHTLIINTRQYRAPEVILENHSWDEKSDIWSMACIVIELYTGELFFDTHDNNLEHLAMIEKQCGAIPLRMAQNCHAFHIKSHLQLNGDREEEASVASKGRRLRWPAAARSQQSAQNVRNMLLLQDIMRDEFGQQHSQLRSLLQFMLKIDPYERPSASECLKHPFFTQRFFSNSTEKTQLSTGMVSPCDRYNN